MTDGDEIFLPTEFVVEFKGGKLSYMQKFDPAPLGESPETARDELQRFYEELADASPAGAGPPSVGIEDGEVVVRETAEDRPLLEAARAAPEAFAWIVAAEAPTPDEPAPRGYQ